MATSRRRFLKAGALSIACAGASGVVSKAAAATAQPNIDLFASSKGASIYSKESFTPFLNTTFSIHASALERVNVTLTRIRDHKQVTKDAAKIPGQENFSLFFRDSNNSLALTQGTYVLEHGQREPFVLFIVPVGKPGSGLYEAIIHI